VTLIPAAAAVAAVIYGYAFFASHGKFVFTPIAWDQHFEKPAEGFYASQAEGFLRGTLSIAHRPDPKLVAMKDPYNHDARWKGEVPYLWDASYFNGRYYLYFSPLPALLFHLPFRYFSGLYPHDITAGLFFATWAFVMIAAFVGRALAGRKRQLPLCLWLAMLGIGNLIPVVIVFCRTYEIAILCGAAMSATFAFTLLLFVEKPTTPRLLHASIWLALAIAARPNLGLLVLVLFAAIWSKRRSDWLKALAFASIPLILVGASIATYNYKRFGNPLEMGVKYQLTYMYMGEYRVCSCKTAREAVRVINTAGVYLGSPLTFAGEFPFVRLTMQNLDWKVSFNQYSDLIGGIGVIMPIAIIGSLFAAVLALRKTPNDDRTRGGLFAAGAGWLALLGLSTCWYASARYELDFMLLIAAGAVIAIESALTWLGENGVSVTPIKVALIAIACYSILTGILLGFTGAHDAFSYNNPELFKRLGDFFR
jgi:hypothetical protein